MLIEVSHWSKEWRGSAQGQRVCVAELPQITPHRGLWMAIPLPLKLTDLPRFNQSLTAKWTPITQAQKGRTKVKGSGMKMACRGGECLVWSVDLDPSNPWDPDLLVGWSLLPTLILEYTTNCFCDLWFVYHDTQEIVGTINLLFSKKNVKK